jgi:hypothetical protein
LEKKIINQKVLSQNLPKNEPVKQNQLPIANSQVIKNPANDSALIPSPTPSAIPSTAPSPNPSPSAIKSPSAIPSPTPIENNTPPKKFVLGKI